MTARQKFRTGCYYGLGALWIVFIVALVIAALVVLLGWWVATLVGAWILGNVALTWLGVL